MRSAKVADCWRTTLKRKYENYIEEMDLCGLLGIDKVVLSGGIFAICGLNGAGKSTIISAIKDILGIAKSEQDIKKLGSQQLSAKLHINSSITVCNNINSRAIDLGLELNTINFIDYEKSTKSVDFLYTQTNLDELVEQNEEHFFNGSELEGLNYLVGKHYDTASVIEIDDIENLGTVPYFKVNCHNVDYDSTRMGVGEHFLFYIFWILNQLSKNTILIIEEPETFISIASQQNLMNFIASIVADKGITVILSTHSPFILYNIPNQNIRIVSRYATESCIAQPSSEYSALALLGAHPQTMGTFFVEDNVAKMFLTCLLEKNAPNILRNFNIESVGGESYITERLKFPYSEIIHYKFIGIYDGDMKGSIKELELKWPFLYFPLKNAVESEIRDLLRKTEKLTSFCDLVRKSRDIVIIVLSKLDGTEHHDWFLDFCIELSLDSKFVIKCFYELWYNTAEKDIEEFIKNLLELTA